MSNPALARGRLDSGIRGKVIYGPTCPVEGPGETCVKPYQATLRVLKRTSRKVIARVRSDTGGHFVVRLTPGRYLIEPVSGNPYPRGAPQPATVHRHRFTRITIIFDSGIR